MSFAGKLDSVSVPFQIACQLIAAPRADITAGEIYEYEPSEQRYSWNSNASQNFHSPHSSVCRCDRGPVNRASQSLCCRHPDVVNSIRSLSNPYHATWNQGGQAFAKSIGAEYVTLVTEGDSEKGIADIRAILAKTGGNMVLNVDPNDSPDARPIVEACVKAGAYVTTQWNKPADLHPWDFNPNYVAHIAFDGVHYGEDTGNALIKAIGGSGGIVALGGILSNTPAIERKTGLEKALKANPNVKLLDFQVANWKSTEAFNIVSAWLTRFGGDIKGIWAANDDMAVGTLEALRAEKLAARFRSQASTG